MEKRVPEFWVFAVFLLEERIEVCKINLLLDEGFIVGAGTGMG